MSESRPPIARHTTVRQALADTLRAAPASAHNLSRLVGIPEKAAADHLVHLDKNLPLK